MELNDKFENSSKIKIHGPILKDNKIFFNGQNYFNKY